jgi:phytoene dehydrogenase-like protein
VGSLADKLRVARLRHRCLRGSLAEQLAAPETSTLEFLRENGLGPAIIERFFRPFLGGVFLDPALETSSRMFRFVFRMFAAGEAVLPERGMERIPRQLAARLPERNLRRHAPVDRVEPGRVTLAGGEVLEADRVVVATDAETAARLVPGVRQPAWRDVACVYLAADRAPLGEPWLILDGEGRGPINNLCFPTEVAPSYAPAGRTLVSATVIGEEAAAADVTERVSAQLVAWFGIEARHWRPLRTYHVRRALPAQPPGWLDPPEREARLGDGLYLAGDHLDTASTNGALAAGRRAAEAVIADLG